MFLHPETGQWLRLRIIMM